jgi:hypothetical protein
LLIAISHEHSLPPEEKRQGDQFYLWRSFHLATAAALVDGWLRTGDIAVAGQCLPTW